MTGEVPLSHLRLLMREANAFVLELLSLGRGGRDYIDALILAATYQANSAPLTAEVRLQQMYATLYTPPPDSVRRPISVSALAASLRLPFETVRRRVARLTAEGVVDVSRRGVLFSQRALRSPGHGVALHRNYRCVRSLYRRLKKIGVIDQMGLPAPKSEIAADAAPPLRIVLRLSADYFLRMMETLTAYVGDPISGFVLMAVVQGNTRDLPDEVRGGDAPGPLGFVPDSLRRPVRTVEVATELGMPHESARRRLARLVADGRCRAEGAGFVVPAEVLARPGMMDALGRNQAALQRMFAALAELGVLARWDRDADGVEAAA